MDPRVHIQVALDQLCQDRLHELLVGMLKNDAENVRAADRFNDNVLADDLRRFVDGIVFGIGAAQDFFGSDGSRDISGEVEAGEDADFRVEQVVAARVELANFRVGSGFEFAVDHVSDEQFGFGTVNRLLFEIKNGGGHHAESAEHDDFPFVPEKDVINITQVDPGRLRSLSYIFSVIHGFGSAPVTKTNICLRCSKWLFKMAGYDGPLFAHGH